MPSNIGRTWRIGNMENKILRIPTATSKNVMTFYFDAVTMFEAPKKVSTLDSMCLLLHSMWNCEAVNKMPADRMPQEV